MKDNPKDMSNVEIKDGEVLMPEVHANAYWDTWPITIGQVRGDCVLICSFG
jgi:hypothetical protein